MEAAGRRLGALTLISRTAGFTDEQQDTAVMAAVFAAHAAVALTGARQVSDVNAALTDRDVIGQAKGILMERFQVTPEVAFAMPVRTSSISNLKMREVRPAVPDRNAATYAYPTAPRSGPTTNDCTALRADH